jgi:uncharacterized integral membrane protein
VLARVAASHEVLSSTESVASLVNCLIRIIMDVEILLMITQNLTLLQQDYVRWRRFAKPVINPCALQQQMTS